MLKILRKLFAKKETYVPLITEELWRTDFSKQKNRRWNEVNTDSYALFFSKDGMHLKANKPFLYIWEQTENEYKDLIIETIFFLQPGQPQATADTVDTTVKNGFADSGSAGSCAGGILFRSTGTSYYSVLVSDRGFIRMDAVFNENPVPLLGWIALPTSESQQSERHLRIIARGTRFLILVDGKCIASIDDDTIQSTGTVCCAIQNWGSATNAEAVFEAFLIDSRLAYVESLFDAGEHQIINPEIRCTVAEGLFAVGRTLAALAVLQKIPPESCTRSTAMLGARICQSLHLYDKSRTFLEQIPDFKQTVQQDSVLAECYAENLYLQNDFTGLIDFIRSIETLADTSPALQNLLGHSLYETQNWIPASKAYAHAAELQNNEGLFSLNAARAIDKATASEPAESSMVQSTRAEEFYINAAESFLRNENYEDLAAVVPILSERASQNPRACAVVGKYYYAAGDFAAAEIAFAPIIKNGTADASVWYLTGLIQRAAGKKEIGRNNLQKAAELEPSFDLYRCRYAESLFLDGDKESALQEIQATLAIAPDSGWTLNLAASIALQSEADDVAAEYIEKARKLLPSEFPVLENFVESERRRNGALSVLTLLDPNAVFTDSSSALAIPDSAAVAHPGEAYNLGANILLACDHFDEADRWYEQALSIEPDSIPYLVNRAALCLTQKRFSEADALLAKAHRSGGSADVYRMIGYIAAQKGDFSRAEVSCRQGIDEYPTDSGLYYDLVSVYLDTGRAEKAAETLALLRNTLPEESSDERFRNVHDKVMSYTHRIIACSSCSQKWYIPKSIPLQSPLRLAAEPPDTMPAGICVECGRSFCIGCAKNSMDNDGRFRCTVCGGRLKLSDQGFLWIYQQWLNENRDSFSESN